MVDVPTLVTRTPADRSTLPEFEVPEDGSGVLRLELSAPTAGPLVVFHRTRRAPECHHDRAYELQLPTGRSVVRPQLAAAEQTCRARIRPGREAGRFVLHAAAVRACALR